jgi:Tol biopolymer transport system component
MRRLSVGSGAVALVLCAALVPGGTAHADNVASTSLVSVALDGGPSHGSAREASVSADGRYVAFRSSALDLVANDTNQNDDIFVRDRQAGVTTRVSVDSAGAQANGPSELPSISADGRYVAFESLASNLVPGDTNKFSDVFVHDLRTGVTSRISVGPLGAQANSDSWRPAISADGRFVAYESHASNLVGNDTNRTHDIFEYDRLVDYTLRVSVDSNNAQANNWSLWPSISADGRYVAFESYATNISPAPDANGGIGDVFVHDRYSWQTDLVSVNASGVQGDSVSRFSRISADGRHVAFESLASNLVPGDTNDEFDQFVVDRQTHAVTRVNVLPPGEQDRGGSAPTTRPTISADGRYVAFNSGEDVLVPQDNNSSFDVFLRDRDTATTTRASLANDGSEVRFGASAGAISGDGRHVAFSSSSPTLMPDAEGILGVNVFIRDLTGRQPAGVVTVIGDRPSARCDRFGEWHDSYT